MLDKFRVILYIRIFINHNKRKTMANIAKCARATAVMNKVKGNDPFAFTRRFLGYNELTEGIIAQQRQADLKLQKILFNKKAKGVA
jgi:hypothetical protein